MGKREIARAFGIKGDKRIELKRLLREMADEGVIEGTRRTLVRSGDLPPVGVIEVIELDADGELIARPAKLERAGDEQHRIRLVPSKLRGGTTPGVGDRVLAHIDPLPEADEAGCAFQARAIKVLPRDQVRLLGIYRKLTDGSGIIDPVDRRQLKEWQVRRGDDDGAKAGELVRFELSKRQRYGVAQARILERLGDPAAQGAQSLIAIEMHGLRDRFPDAVMLEAEACEAADLTDREDLRDLPLITIDPAGARDHDDAVWASPDDDAANSGGWIVIVAIADVAHYVTAGSALDREAQTRGNSTYFPDRVLPMLPEALSSGLCSLVDGEDRAVLAVRMVFDRTGAKRNHRFFRGLMRSNATLTYQQAQAAIDLPDQSDIPASLQTVIASLFGAYRALVKARQERQPLDLDLPERKITLDKDGRVESVNVPPRLDAHRLVEEFMIQANVAAAESLERKSTPLIYRIHDSPSAEKLLALSNFLKTIDLKIPRTGHIRPHHFNQVLDQAAKRDLSMVVSDVVLRSQAQAEYNPVNCGHFGLNLQRYAHFTSPIRRYADLIVHRALIRAFGLGAGGLNNDEINRLESTAEAISQAERRAMAAERETVERLIADFLSDRVGAQFDAVVSGAVRSGLFVRLAETGADGFVPASTIGHEFFLHDETHHALYGEASGREFALGDQVKVRLVEAIPSAGALRFEMLSEGVKRKRKARPARSGARPGGRRRHHRKR